MARTRPAHREIQEDGRIRHWFFVPELGKYLRVVTLEDGETVHNAFPDRNFWGGGRMTLHYYPETDSLYIDLSEQPGTESREVSPGVVLDFDQEGHFVGIDVDHASKILNLSRLEVHSLPTGHFSIAQ